MQEMENDSAVSEMPGNAKEQGSEMKEGCRPYGSLEVENSRQGDRITKHHYEQGHSGCL